MPTEYKAIASYSGTQSVSYVLGYITTVNYSGIVTKKTVGSINYTITYAGMVIPVPETEPPPTTEKITEEITETAETTAEAEEIPDETEEISENAEDETNEVEPAEKAGFNWLVPLLIAVILLLATGTLGVIYYLKYVRKKNSASEISIYNLVDEEYILLGVEPLDADEEISDLSVDLDKFGDSAKSNSFGFVLNKHSAETLNGEIMDVSYNGETLTHMINKTDDSDEYRFKLVFGETS